MIRTLACCLALAAVTLTTASAAERPPRADLGHGTKWKILVDKVMQPKGNWHTEEWMVAEAAAAGFNVWSPRRGHDDLDEVRAVNEWCRAHGIFHMPWMRGTLVAPGDASADGKRVVWGSGQEQALWSPNADEFWDWTTRYIVEYARIAAQDETLVGVFLDYENYAPGPKPGNLYDLSYDDIILELFAQDQGLDVPELALDARKPWLVEQGLHDAFEAFQIEHWRQRCRALRQAVDAHAPDFQFAIYPAPGTRFMTDATYPEWGTDAAPLILADASIYGRPGLWAGHAQALQANHETLARRRAMATALPGGPYQYAGGLDPVVAGADPEFTGRNAAMSADLTDGYWVFYEGPTYDGTHRDYFDWFTRANAAIDAGEAGDFWRAPRESDDTSGLTELVPLTERPQLLVHDTRPRLRAAIDSLDLFEIHALAGNAASYLAGADVVVLQNFNQEYGPQHPFVQRLRAYVEAGGGLLLGHDTAWYMASPFPEVATRAVPTHTSHVEAGYHVVHTDLVIGPAHAALAGLDEGTRFATEFYDHMIFEPGPQGAVLARNVLGDPVYVAGQVGKGRVVFSGCYYGYAKPLAGVERQLLQSAVRWLAGAQ